MRAGCPGLPPIQAPGWRHCLAHQAGGGTDARRQVWSPQQIAAWLALACRRPGDARACEAIYLSLFVQARGALRKELFRRMRTSRARRRPQGLTVNNGQARSAAW